VQAVGLSFFHRKCNKTFLISAGRARSIPSDHRTGLQDNYFVARGEIRFEREGGIAMKEGWDK